MPEDLVAKIAAIRTLIAQQQEVAAFNALLDLRSQAAGNTTVLSEIGRCFTQIGQHSSAVDTWRDVVNIAPDSTEAQFYLADAQTYATFGDVMREVDVRKKLDDVMARPDVSGTLWLGLAGSLERLGAFDDALAAAKAAHRAGADGVTASATIIALQIRMGRRWRAYGLLRRVVRRPGLTVPELGLLSDLASRAGAPSLALTLARRQVELDRGLGPALSLCQALIRKRRTAEIAPIIEPWLPRLAIIEDAGAILVGASILSAIGWFDQEIAMLEGALQTHPGHPRLAEALRSAVFARGARPPAPQ